MKTIREAFDLLYHVPWSQVHPGSRGGQTGLVHLHVKAGDVFVSGRIRRSERQALCGRRGWYERPLEAGEGESLAGVCGRCVDIATRDGLVEAGA